MYFFLLQEYDEELYPEKYRKPSHFRSVQDEDVLSDPFEIGYICAIWSRKKTITKSADVRLKLKKFYRPHNTSLSRDEIRKLDLNLLYSSDEGKKRSNIFRDSSMSHSRIL